MIYLLYITTFLHFLLGGYLILRDFKSKVNISFAAFLFGIAFWSFTNAQFQSSANESEMFQWTLYAYTAATFMLLTLLLFTHYINEFKINIKSRTVIIVISIISFVIPYIPNFVTTGVDFEKKAIKGGDFLFLLFLTYLFLIFFAIRNLLRGVQISVSLKKSQLAFVFTGVIAAVISGVITNLVFPTFGNYTLVAIGPSFTLVFLTFVSYAILRYRFLDIRVLVGRITYFSVLAVFVVIFYYTSYTIDYLSFGTSFKLEAILTGVPLATIFVVVFNSVNRFIREKIDSTLISPDYDPKEVVSQFNNKVSTVLDYQDIAQTAIDTLAKTIRASFEALVLNNPSRDVEIIKGKKEIHIEIAEFGKALEVWQQIGKHPIILDEIEIEMPTVFKNFEDNIEYIVTVMKTHELKILLPMGRESEIIGILMLGKKEGDSPYNSIELDFLKSITDLTGLALTRAFLYNEVQEFNITLQHKVDVATEQLADKNKKLEATLQYERDMLDIMGHELRTPLTTARNALVVMESYDKKGTLKKPDLERYLNISLENVRREIQLVETILASTKIDNDKLDLKKEKVETNDVVQDSFVAYQEAAKKKELKLSTSIPKETVFALADRLRIQQVLDNLVSNAIKYTQEGSVEIGLESPSEGMLKFYVKDTGEGIPATEIPNLGKKFYRINNYLQSSGKLGNRQIVRPGGTGIGLYVVFQLVKAMNGEVKVDSTVGKGSTFSFTLPVWKEGDVSVLPDKSGLN